MLDLFEFGWLSIPPAYRSNWGARRQEIMYVSKLTLPHLSLVPGLVHVVEIGAMWPSHISETTV